jgi:DNA uptake protein ComE-like DNA-binding protein
MNTRANSQITVTVQGAVKNPGVYQLPKGSRLVDLMNRAKANENADLFKLDMGLALNENDKINIPVQDNSNNSNYSEYQRTTVYNNQKIQNNKTLNIQNTEIQENIVDDRTCNTASSVAKSQLMNLNVATEKDLIDRFGKYGLKINEALAITDFRKSQNNLKITSVCQLLDAKIIYASMANLIVNEVYILK